MEPHTRELLLQRLSVLVNVQAIVPQAHWLEGEGQNNDTHWFRPQSGGVEVEGMTIYSQFLDTVLKNHILVVIGHPTVANLLSAGLDYLLELGLYKTTVVCPVGVDPAPMDVWQALVRLLGLKGLLRRGPPHEAIVEVVRVVIHEYDGWPESRVG